MTKAVSQIIGSESASAPTCHETPICGIISKGVFSSSYPPKSMFIQSMSLRDVAAAHVEIASRANATPMQMFLATPDTWEESSSGRMCGSAISRSPTAMGRRERMVRIIR